MKPGLPQIHFQLHILLIPEIFWKKMKWSDLLSVNGNQFCPLTKIYVSQRTFYYQTLSQVQHATTKPFFLGCCQRKERSSAVIDGIGVGFLFTARSWNSYMDDVDKKASSTALRSAHHDRHGAGGWGRPGGMGTRPSTGGCGHARPTRSHARRQLHSSLRVQNAICQVCRSKLLLIKHAVVI